MNILEGDIADFKMVLKRNDESENDYTLECINNIQDDENSIKYIESYFLVTRKSNQIKKKYNAGPGNLWLNHFENDLKKGAFNA
ncbi:hypothetical protein [Legionella maioricensis]|uniref:Uncharacterized protein n=1 Tax=Legionella maioricensis TaxID=2896528 RepID=A0A9X2ICK7_9GAMM|nr:hypothetical protein [Legionella maioricensis]MCL9684547.1 hypothetical protein [Legionella maioricensis]MCL9687859.1 hypothetical protein [Legionella maioricensis]